MLLFRLFKGENASFCYQTSKVFFLPFFFIIYSVFLKEEDDYIYQIDDFSLRIVSIYICGVACTLKVSSNFRLSTKKQKIKKEKKKETVS